MKKVLVSVIVAILLAGCAHDYYTGNVKYVQNGKHCEYSFEEEGGRLSSDVRDLNASKKMVYRNTKCEDLFIRDNGGQIPGASRRVLKNAGTVTVAGMETSTLAGAPRLIAMPQLGAIANRGTGYKYYLMSAM